MNNLRLLILDMEREGWVIELFPFTYNGVDCTVILKLYQPNVRKPNKYARAYLEFIKLATEEKIDGYANLSFVNFFDAVGFFKFFNIEYDSKNDDARAIFSNFSEYFISHIPAIRRNNHTEQEKDMMGSRLDTNPGRYCFNVIRNGNNGQRSIENSNKTRIYRPELFEMLKEDTTLSFCYSTDASQERTDIEIRDSLAARH